MMARDMMELQIAATPVRAAIPADKPLPERLAFAMRYVREHERDLFWMIGNADDDMKFRTALAAVMLAGSDDDKREIERAMKALRALAAMMAGIPVDMEAALADATDVLPLMKMWRECEAA